MLRNGVPRGEADTLAAPDPLPATLSRRGALAMVGAGSLLLLITSAGRSFDGPLRRIALLTPRGGTDRAGAQRLPDQQDRRRRTDHTRRHR